MYYLPDKSSDTNSNDLYQNIRTFLKEERRCVQNTESSYLKRNKRTFVMVALGFVYMLAVWSTVLHPRRLEQFENMKIKRRLSSVRRSLKQDKETESDEKTEVVERIPDEEMDKIKNDVTNFVQSLNQLTPEEIEMVRAEIHTNRFRGRKIKECPHCKNELAVMPSEVSCCAAAAASLKRGQAETLGGKACLPSHRYRENPKGMCGPFIICEKLCKLCFITGSILVWPPCLCKKLKCCCKYEANGDTHRCSFGKCIRTTVPCCHKPTGCCDWYKSAALRRMGTRTCTQAQSDWVGSATEVGEQVTQWPCKCAWCFYNTFLMPWGKLLCMGYWAWFFGFTGYCVWMLGEVAEHPGTGEPHGDQIFPFYNGVARGAPIGDGIGFISDIIYGIVSIFDDIPGVDASEISDLNSQFREALNRGNMEGAGITSPGDQDALMAHIDGGEKVYDLYDQYYWGTGDEMVTVFEAKEGRFHWDMNMFEVITGLDYVRATMIFALLGMCIGLMCFAMAKKVCGCCCQPIPLIGKTMCGED